MVLRYRSDLESKSGTPAGGAVVLMHNPSNQLEFVDVKNVQKVLSAGYVAVRAAELGELISTLKQQNSKLETENTRLRIEVAKLVPSTPTGPSQTEAEAERRAELDAENTARRQQIIQSWLMRQNMNRTRNYNITVSDCTRFPALCAGK